jgi:hypothetical protein
VIRKPWAGWKFRLPWRGPRQAAVAGAEQEIIHGGNQIRAAPELWPEVADHELALMAAEFLSGTPYPDLEDAAEVAAWRAEHADLLSKGPEAVMELADAREAEFDWEAEQEQEDAEQAREQADWELEWLERQSEAEGELDRQQDAEHDRQGQAPAGREPARFDRQPGTDWELEP